MFSFSDIVDEDERSLERRVRHVFVGWFVESVPFRYRSGDCHMTSCDPLHRIAMLLVILLNCVVIGIQTDRYLVSNDDVITIVLQQETY